MTGEPTEELVEGNIDFGEIISDDLEVSEYQPPVVGIAGTYTMAPDGIRLPSMTAAIKLKNFAALIRIAEQVPALIDREWILSELFQRDIDMDRVRDEIIGKYLNDPAKDLYFPSITVVMIPMNPAGDNEVLDAFPDAEGDECHYPDAAGSAEGLFVEKYLIDERKVLGMNMKVSRLNDIARLQWDSNKVMAVAIDGQHRLKAIVEHIAATYDGTPTKEVAATRLPVTFIFPTEGFGYTGEKNPREISRQIFIDVNKTAKTVQNNRLVLLDDTSVASVCTRSVVTEKIPGDDDKRLPLCMMIWKEDKVPFNDRWELNSICNLEAIVSQALSLNTITKPTDKENVLKYINSLGKSLGEIKLEIEGTQMTLEEYYLKEYCVDETVDGGDTTKVAIRPFDENHIPADCLRDIETKFKEQYRTYIVKLLREFSSYSNYLTYASDNNLITGDFGGFHSQPKAHKGTIKAQKGGQWYADNIIEKENALKGLKSHTDGERENIDIMWYVVNQRALLEMGRLISKVWGGENPILGSIDDFLKNMNELAEKDAFNNRVDLPEKDNGVWGSIATAPISRNPLTRGTVTNRTEALLGLWHTVCQLDRMKLARGEEPADIDGLALLLSNDDHADDYPKAAEWWETLRKTFTESAVICLVELEPAEKETVANSRLKALIKFARDGIVHDEVQD